MAPRQKMAAKRETALATLSLLLLLLLQCVSGTDAQPGNRFLDAFGFIADLLGIGSVASGLFQQPSFPGNSILFFQAGNGNCDDGQGGKIPGFDYTDFSDNVVASGRGDGNINCNGGFNSIQVGINQLPQRLVISATDLYHTDAICLAYVAWSTNAPGGAAGEIYNGLILGDMLKDAGYDYDTAAVPLSYINDGVSVRTTTNCFWLSSSPTHPSFINSIVVWDVNKYHEDARQGLITTSNLHEYLGIIRNSDLCASWVPGTVFNNNCELVSFDQPLFTCTFCPKADSAAFCDRVCS